jgi:nucleotide-binding universal stress UspA family protein
MRIPRQMVFFPGGEETMAFKRLLLLLCSYPTQTPAGAARAAVDIAAMLDAKISALSCAIRRHVPKGVLSGVVGTVPGLVGQESREVVEGAQQLLDLFSDLAQRRGVMGQAVYKHCPPKEVPKLLAGYARVNDLTVLPMPEGSYLDQLDSHWYLEAALFDSGRPILVLPHGYSAPDAGAFGTVIVAWDQTRAAARALADAMPILRQANSVRVVTIINEKAILEEPPPFEVVLHLAAHDIRAEYDAVEAKGRDAATAIVEYLRAHSGELLVMGGYGRSRLREVILGGATKHILTHPPVPVLMAH